MIVVVDNDVINIVFTGKSTGPNGTETNKKDVTLPVVVSLVAVFVLIVVSFVIAFLWRRKKLRSKQLKRLQRMQYKRNLPPKVGIQPASQPASKLASLKLKSS